MEEKDPTSFSTLLRGLKDDIKATENAIKGYRSDILSKLPTDLEEITVVKKNKDSSFKRFIEKIKKII